MEFDTKAFQSCEAKKIVITGCDMVIGENAFSYCEDITEIYIRGSNIKVETYAFYDTGKAMSVNIENCTGILDQKAFQACGIAGLTINNSTLELDENVFSYCEDLTDIIIGAGNTEIGTYSFYDCASLVNVDIKGVLSDIGDYAFYDCPAELVINYNGGSYNKESIEDAK